MKNSTIIRKLTCDLLTICLLMLGIIILTPASKASAYNYELKPDAKRSGKIVKEDAVEDGSVVSVVENSDFRITLKTEKAEYHAGDGIRLKAVVEYIGSAKEKELVCCDPVVSYSIEGSNGINLIGYVYYYKKDLTHKTFVKGEKYEEDFTIEKAFGSLYGKESMFDEDEIRNWDGFTVFYLPKGTYTFTAALTSEIAQKKTTTFYAELHLNIDVEGEVFYDGVNRYRTLNETEAVLIGTKTDTELAQMGFKSNGGPLDVPETVKYNGKKYKVTAIGDEGYKGYGFIEDYTYGDVYSGVFSGKTFSYVKIPASVKKISRYAFKDTTINGNLTINANNLEIGDRAFQNTGSWERNVNLVIKGGNVSLGELCFDYSWFQTIDAHTCKSLSIGDMAFADMYALKKVSLPENTVSIGSRAFYDSAERTDKVVLTIPKGTKNIEGPVANAMIVKISEDNPYYVVRYGVIMSADGSTVLGIADFRTKVIALPEGVSEIKPYAFSATPVKKITIPDSVTVIPKGMAARANSLKKVKLGKNVTEIGDNAFWATALKKVTLPNGLKSIGSYAFANCKMSDSKVTIPKTVEAIGNMAFSGNYNLKITFKKHNKTYKQSGDVLYKAGTKTVIGLVYSNINDAKYEKLDLQTVLKGSIYNLTIPDSVKEVDVSSFSSELMGEYYTGKNVVYEGAQITFESKEPPKFVDERNSEKEFFVWIIIPDDGDAEAYKIALEEAGLTEKKNYNISKKSQWDYDL